MRAKSCHQEKQEEYMNKLRIIDQHIAKTTATQDSGVNFEDILKMLARSLLPDPPQELIPFTTKVALFQQKKVRRFNIKEMTVEKGKQFILRVITHTPVKISIAVDDSKPKFYSIQGSKGISIQQQAWKELLITVSMQKNSMFTSVKLLLDSIRIDHKNPKKGNVNIRPNIDKELEDYLKLTKGKSKEIIRSRSLAQSQQNFSRKRVMSSATLSTQRKGEMARTMSELFKFQKKKTFYIRHVQRMSPDRIKLHKQKQTEYGQIKRLHMEQLSKLIMIVKFGLYIREQKIKIHRKILLEIKIHFLCLDFIKIIKNKFRLKMTQKARSRMTLLHYYENLPAICYQSSIKKARKTLMFGLMPYMEFRGLQELGENSQEYLKSIKIIQSFLKQKAKNFRERIQIITDRFCIIYHLELSEKGRKATIERYFKECQNSNIFHFYANKIRLLQILREEAL